MLILIAIDYCTHWTKAKTFKNCTAKVVMDFLEEYIVTRFGMSFFLVYNNRSSFVSIFLTQGALDNQVIIKLSSNYYPQGNGLVESTNKNLITVIKCLLKENPKDWNTTKICIMDRLSQDKKNSLGLSPYLIIYGQEPIFPLNLKMPILKFMKGYADDTDRV